MTKVNLNGLACKKVGTKIYFSCVTCKKVGAWSLWWNNRKDDKLQMVRMCPECGRKTGLTKVTKGLKI